MKMNNEELYYKIKQKAFKSVYWTKQITHYQLVQYYDYAPMITDELFNVLFNEADTVGVQDIEERLGRRLYICELKPCLLSCNYFLFGNPLLCGDNCEEEREVLVEFDKYISEGIRKNETRTLNKVLKDLQNKKEQRNK